MNLSEYARLAPLTASKALHFDKVSLRTLRRVLFERLHWSDFVDAAKKGLFYGKDQPLLEDLAVSPHPLHEEFDEKFFEGNMDLAHGVIGMDTEAAELLEKLLHGGLTREAFIDEAGDLLWYLVLACRGAGTTLEEVATANSAKLAKRFPNGSFALKDWENRDKEAEHREMVSAL